jgi:MFS superfamily sulfate permease-like transporter
MDREPHFFRDHYEAVLDVCFIAVVTFIIFFLNIHRGVQIVLAIACALVLIGGFHSPGADDRPCGADVSGEPIARSKGGFSPS